MSIRPRSLLLFPLIQGSLLCFLILSQKSFAFSCSYFEYLNMEVLSPDLQRFLGSKSIDRLMRSQSQTFKLVEEATAIKVEDGRSFSFNIDDPEAQIGLVVSNHNGEIRVEIDYFATRDVEFKERNKGLSLAFPRLLAAIASGINKQVARDPNLLRFRITGKDIVQPDLVPQLRRFGFADAGPARPSTSAISAVSNSFTQLVGGMLKSQGSNKQIKTGTAFFGSKRKKKNSGGDPMGHDWELVLELGNGPGYSSENGLELAPSAVPDM